MSLDLPRELVDRLVDPESHRPVRLANETQLEALRHAIRDGSARRRDGGDVPSAFDGAFLTEDGKRAYLVIDGIPNFLVDERLELVNPLG